MTKDEFRKRWRTKLTAMALFGVVSDVRDGPLQRAGHVLDIPAEVDKMLEQIYEDLASQPAPAKPANGQPTGPLPVRKA
jgi:hypothetical protein